MSRLYRMVGADGVPAYHELPLFKPYPDGAVRVDRLPGPGEDFVDGAWTCNHKAVADSEAGPVHIAEAHALKYLEALVVTAGVTPATGLLAHEAEARGMPVAELAAEVLAKRGAFVAKEVTRQLRQAGESTAFTIPPGDPLAGGN